MYLSGDGTVSHCKDPADQPGYDCSGEGDDDDDNDINPTKSPTANPNKENSDNGGGNDDCHCTYLRV